jgi:ABC-type lipoprotein export system ATPase subunit
VLVTHDHELAALADRQIALREGRVVSDSAGATEGAQAVADSPTADTTVEATR